MAENTTSNASLEIAHVNTPLSDAGNTAPSSSSTQNSNNGLPLMPRIASGIAGSIITSLLVQPLEVVKVRQQSYLPRAAQQASSSTSSTFLCPQHGIVVTRNPGFSKIEGSVTQKGSGPPGTFRMMNQIWKADGISGLYAGLKPGLIMYIPSTVLYFTAYDELVLYMKNSNHAVNSLKRPDAESWFPYETAVVPLVAGSLARILATSVTSPLEFIRTRQAGGISGSVFSKDKTFLEGISHMYRGLIPTLWRDVPFSGVYWLGVETIRRKLEEFQQTNALTFTRDKNLTRAGNAFISGAISGMVASGMTTPFDVVKTRYQMDLVGSEGNRPRITLTGRKNHSSTGAGNWHTSPSLAGHHHQHQPQLEYCCPIKQVNRLSSLSCICVDQYPPAAQGGNGVWSQMRYIVETEGFGGLWRGNVTRMIKVAPACAIMISSYEFGKSVLIDATR
jgi:solute carrier family 25 protein 39/40